MHERDVLLAALEKALPEEREAYLEQACGGDAALRSRVDVLLRASEVQDSFLEHPAVETELLSRETEGMRRVNSEHDKLSLDFLHPTDDPQLLGRVGPYEVLEVIGRGGMGVVLKARDTKLNRVVAIKVLAPELASNPTARKRFQREAHAAAAVVHQHIVTIHAVDEDRLPYLVMECIVGQSLKEKIDREGHLKLIEIVRIGQQVAAGLAAAHAHGLIHRDVKPANILLENGVERVRITDFGLARAVDDVGMTRTGEVAGTPQYMSPEQAQGLPMDARSDLFSFGSVLYAMCTGRPPFRAETAFATARRVCEDTPRPIREVNPEIPEWLVEIVDRLLEKQPADRFQSAEEIAALLGQHLAHLQQPGLMPRPEKALTPPRKTARRWQQYSVVALIALLAVACAFGLTEASGVTKVMPTVIRIVRGEGTLVIELDDPTVQVSLDGEELSIRGAGLQELKLTAGQYRLHATKDGQPVKDEVVTVTRDGRKVVTVTREASGSSASPSVSPAPQRPVGELTLLAKLDGHSDLVRGAAFLPDGRRFVSVGRDKMVRIWDVTTRSIVSTLPVEGYLRDADVSADGRYVAVAFSANGKDAVVHVWDLEKRVRIAQLVKTDYRIDHIRIAPNATHVVTGGHPSGGILWDLESEQEVRRFDVNNTSPTLALEYSTDGQTLAIGTVGGVRLFNSETGITLGDARLPRPRGVLALGFAPDGKSLACGQLGGHLSIVDVQRCKVTTTLPSAGEDAHVLNVRFLDDRRLMVTCHNGTIQLWDLEKSRLVATAATEMGTTKQLSVSPDRRYAITAEGEIFDAQTRSYRPSGDYALRLWQLPESVWAKMATGDSPTKELPSVSAESAAAGAFVVLGGKGVAERKFDTLAEAVLAASDGDTIEIRGNGPFVSDGSTIRQHLVIRAGEGYTPSITLSQTAAESNALLIDAHASLVLEGLELSSASRWVLRTRRAGALQLTNCRLVHHVARQGGGTTLYAEAPSLTLRNCELLTNAATSIHWEGPARGVTLVENCVSSAGSANFLFTDQSQRELSLRLRNSSFAGDCMRVSFHAKPDLLDDALPLLHLEFSQNITRSNAQERGLLFVHQYQLERPFSPAEAEAAFGRLIDLHEVQNVYQTGTRTLRHGLLWGAPFEGDVVGWDRIWKSDSHGAVEGDVRFAGGDLLNRARFAPAQLKAADFRLLPDSAGYRAGPDGKDLGADVDMVGPGPAYERWKKTPEYQEWLKETGQAKESGDRSQ